MSPGKFSIFARLGSLSQKIFYFSTFMILLRQPVPLSSLYILIFWGCECVPLLSILFMFWNRGPCLVLTTLATINNF